MRQSLGVSDTYEAVRETVQRLYVAAGGDPKKAWLVQPFPDTACIRDKQISTAGKRAFVMGLPALPMAAQLSVGQRNLLLAYGWHEALHALKTDFSAIIDAGAKRLSRLLNGIEDARIELWASNVPSVPESRVMLETLTDHIVTHAFRDGGAHYDMAEPRQLSFTLCTALMFEVLGYRLTAWPKDWRAKIPAAWLPAFELAIRELPGLKTTRDALALTEQVANMLKPKVAPAPAPVRAPNEALAELLESLAEQLPKSEDDGDEDGDDKTEDEAEQAPAPDAPPPPDKELREDIIAGAEDDPTRGASPSVEDMPGGIAPNDAETLVGTEPPAAQEPEPSVDVTDDAQEPEDKLGDMEKDLATRFGMRAEDVTAENIAAEAFFTSVDGMRVDMKPTRQVDKVRDLLATSAKLRRDVGLSLRAPERVAFERGHVSGRLDMRQVASMRAGSANVFRRRIEDEGRETAVSLLVDMSSSMEGMRMRAAASLALHLGDAIMGAGAKFEVAGFFNIYGGYLPVAELGFAKEFKDAWNKDAKQKTAGMAYHSQGGTACLPAAKVMCERLVKLPNVNRRILMVLTDGDDGYSPHAMLTLRKHFARKGVEVFCLAIGISKTFHGPIPRSYGENVIYVENLRSIAEQGLATLAKALARSASAQAAGRAA